MSLDMVTAGNIYCGGDGLDQTGAACSPNNSMTVGTIDPCLTTAAPGNNVQHNHTAHLIIQNVEDLIAWQVRFNYLGDQMRPSTFGATPFTDSFTGQTIGFVNLPIDGDVHRDVIPASNIPPAAPGPQTALIGAVYNQAQNFAVSPDTPQKAPHDEANQTYGTTGGGILATLTLQVLAGNAGNPSLFMNLDDDFPTLPGSTVNFFNGTGAQEFKLTSGALGDGFHGEGIACAPVDCVGQECPAAVTRQFSFTNQHESSASDLHMRFDPNAADRRLVQNAPGCPDPVFSPAPGFVDLSVDWGVACVDPGESVILEITSSRTPELECFNWTIFGSPVGDPCTLPTSTPTPTVTPTPGGGPGDTVGDRVFGQGGSFTSAVCNAGGTSATSLCFPGGVAVNGLGNVYVADANNNRVLEYDSPLTSDAVADRVIGQGGSFISGGCNQGGVNSGFCFPISLAVDGAGNLYVADKNNNRVLEYDTPLTSDTIPDRVFGQEGNFSTSTCRGITPESLCSPIGVAVDGGDNLYIVDADNNRVLEYDTPLTTDRVVDRVFGQGSLSTNTCNTSGLLSPPTAATLCTPAGVAIDGGGNVYVADASNSRVLEYNTPLTTDTVADRVFGQNGNFTSGGCNPGGITASSLCAPQAATLDAVGNLYIVDGNSRVLEYDSPLSTDTVAERVFGQPDFSSGGCNQGAADPSADSVCYPIGATVDGSANLYVADSSNNRVLEYDVPVAVGTPTPTATPTPPPGTPTPSGGPSACPTTPPGGDMCTMGIDTRVGGNTNTFVGTIDNCARINANGIIDADEATNVDLNGDTTPDPDILLVDITAQGVPAYNDGGTPGNPADDTDGIVGFQYDFQYPAGDLIVQAHSLTPAAGNPLSPITSMIAANAGSSAFDTSDPVPDDNADDVWLGAALDTGISPPEQGDGVLQRLAITVASATGASQVLISLANNLHLDAQGSAHAPNTTLVAQIAINQVCGPIVTPSPPPPSPTVTPVPTPTRTPSPAPTPTATASPSPSPPPPTPTATPTPVPTPTGLFHDAAVKRLRGPSSVRLSPGIPDSGTVTVVAGNAQSAHADTVGIYLALLPPGGSSNFGGCSPAGVLNLGSLTLLPGDYVTVKTQPNWLCANPGAVDGMAWTLKAVADVHGDDFSACSTLSQMFDGSCAAALASDDSDDFNSSSTRPRPVVVATSP